MRTIDKIPITPKIVGGAIDRNLSQRSAWLKKYYSLFKTSDEKLSARERKNLFLSLNESERRIQTTTKRLQNLSDLFEKMSAAS